jgi:hypothetical protein
MDSAKYAFCESSTFAGCPAFEWYSLDVGNIGIILGKRPCLTKGFSDARGYHRFECDGEYRLAALHHPDQGKDYCTTKWRHSWTKEGYQCQANWFFDYDVGQDFPKED